MEATHRVAGVGNGAGRSALELKAEQWARSLL